MAEIAKLGFCLPGSLVSRTSRCGSRACACHTDPNRLHGPYQSWTRKVNGKTVTRNLSVAQVERYQSWFANAKRLRELISELEALSSTVTATAEGWDVSDSPRAASHPLQQDARGSGGSRGSKC